MANGEKGKGRSQNQRLKLLYLLDYLLEQTDETHTVKVQEIIEHLDNYHKIPIEQKTVCSDLHLLDEYGYNPGVRRNKSGQILPTVGGVHHRSNRPLVVCWCVAVESVSSDSF